MIGAAVHTTSYWLAIVANTFHNKTNNFFRNR